MLVEIPVERTSEDPEASHRDPLIRSKSTMRKLPIALAIPQQTDKIQRQAGPLPPWLLETSGFLGVLVGSTQAGPSCVPKRAAFVPFQNLDFGMGNGMG